MDDAAGTGAGNCLGAVRRAELVVDQPQVPLDRAHRDDQLIGDLPVGTAGCQQAQDRQLAASERRLGRSIGHAAGVDDSSLWCGAAEASGGEAASYSRRT